MSDTHAHTAKVQADVQTGDVHFPPGHVEADRPTERLGGREVRPMAPYLVAGALVLLVLVAGVLLMG